MNTHVFVLTLYNPVLTLYVYVLIGLDDPRSLKGITAVTWEELLDIYKRHSNELGFSVKKSSKRYIKSHEKVNEIYFMCSCEGTSRAKKTKIENPSPVTMDAVIVPSPVVQDQQQNTQKKRRKITVSRTGCKARARVKYDIKNDFYRIESHVIEHNHAMIPTDLNHLKRSARSMNEDKVRAITQFENCHIKPTDSYNMMVAQVGGEENLGHTKKDHINLVGRIRAESIEQGDAQTLVNKMMVRKRKNSSIHF